MSDSSLVTYTKTPKSHYSKRTHIIDTITIHCFVGQVTAKQGCDYFYNTTAKASCNYVVGKDGDIGLCVPEQYRSWCSSNSNNDDRAITIETACDKTAPYKVTDGALNALIKLCADICKRNNIKQLLWKNDKSLIGQVEKQNMTLHKWFAAKACPGDYLISKHTYIANEVNKILNSEVSENMDTKELTRIMGKSVIPAEVFASILINRGIQEYLDIIETYYKAEDVYGIRADLALCQTMLETDWLRFTGRVPKEANNFGGLGAIDSNISAYAKFKSHEEGAIAECQHLLAYASDVIEPTIVYDKWVLCDPRFKYVTRGCAKYVEWLGQQENPMHKGWATGKNYGQKILKIYNDIVDKYEINKQKTDNTIEDLSKRRDTKDYYVQITPTKINLYDKPKGKVVQILERSKQKIIEEQDGFGLIEGLNLWLMLSFTSYIEDAE